MKNIITFVCAAVATLTAVAGEMTYEQRVTAMNCVTEGREDCHAASAYDDEGNRIDSAATANDGPRAVAITTAGTAKKKSSNTGKAQSPTRKSINL